MCVCVLVFFDEFFRILHDLATSLPVEFDWQPLKSFDMMLCSGFLVKLH